MMDGWDGGMTAGWIFMALFWVLLIVGIIWAITQITSSRRDTAESASTRPDDRPDTILARRLARGEIDVETYESLRDALRREDGTPAGVH